MASVENPIIPGFTPDPSICRAGERYYLAASSFAYFPGVPIFESPDLASWRKIGSALTRDSQLPLSRAGVSEGIFAPTIRYHEGKFYLITTLMPGSQNFIVTAEDPAGPWSEPCVLEGARGIDPSLFFDEDGECWYVGQREREKGEYFGDCEIWLSRLDLKSMALTGPETVISRGFQRRAVWPEGPHIFKRDGWYYLIHAEGGTAFHHSVMAARSRRITGPYEYARTNPILTHRHLGEAFPVTSVGHGDLVEDGRGNWYMVCLGCRPEEGFTLLGRETFLAKVTWEDGWPVVNAGIGRLEGSVQLPAASPVKSGAVRYSFDTPAMPPELLSLRNGREKYASLTRRPGFLSLRPGDSLSSDGEPAYIALRAGHKRFDISCEMASAAPGECGAGLALFQNEQNYLTLLSDGVTVTARLIAEGVERTLGRCPAPEGETVTLKLSVRGLAADGFVLADGEWRAVCRGADLRPLSTERAGGFVGCTTGVYAQGGAGVAEFKSLTYEPAE